jgi:6-pyruvoyl tetrahydropterin synthase/QueD family protein
LFSILVKTKFSASHRVTLCNGTKEKLHKHTWQVTVEIAGRKLDKSGFVTDFTVVREKLENIIAPLKNKNLENIEYFAKNGASAELVAKYVFDRMKPQISGKNRLIMAQVSEEKGCFARFSPL